MKHLGNPVHAVSTLVVDEAGAGQRLDNFLIRHLKGAPKALIHRIIRSGEVRVNKGRAQALTKLNPGDTLRIPPIRLEAKPGEAQPSTVSQGAAQKALGPNGLDVVYEDDGLLIVDKPVGLAVHGGSGVRFGVIEAMRALRGETRFLELIHRLDRDTSGLLMLAKKRSMLTAMHALIREGRIDKRYAALVFGQWPHAAKHHVRTGLARYVTSEGENRVAASEADGAQEAHTVFNLIKRGEGGTLLEAQLKTGRTHQIRVHLSSAGYPIAGDDKYGDFARNKLLAKAGFKRMFLHAMKLSFIHPVSGERLRVNATVPPEFAALIEKVAAVSSRPP